MSKRKLLTPEDFSICIVATGPNNKKLSSVRIYPDLEDKNVRIKELLIDKALKMLELELKKALKLI